MTTQALALPAPRAADSPSPFERPQLPRRAFLGRVAAALAIGTTANVGVIVARSAPIAPASVAIPTPAEDPALLALGDQLDPLLTAYREAKARQQDALSIFAQRCPVLPDVLVRTREDRITFAGCTERESDVFGRDVWPEGKPVRPPREILKAGLLRRHMENLSPRSKHGKRVKSLIAVAEKYEAEREAAMEGSGFPDAYEATYHAATAIDVLAWKVRETLPVTMAGVLIHARTLAAHAESEKDGHMMTDRAGLTLGRPLAEAVLRVMAVQS